MSDNCDNTFPGDDQEVTIEVKDRPHVANVQTSARWVAKKLGFSHIDVCRAASSASELASNLIFHASYGGSITIRAVMKDGVVGIEIVSCDEGPGIKDVELALQDGYSTGPGLGSGLPAVNRAMDELEITVTDDSHTLIITRLWHSCE
ncbi:ATP-binding protein [Methanolobus sp. WCC4]|uniref:ATP-binding protein n=1 Tax=Methanolobus sp. WCC4 TaxID=3125784 RepID=UPI0030FB87F6